MRTPLREHDLWMELPGQRDAFQLVSARRLCEELNAYEVIMQSDDGGYVSWIMEVFEDGRFIPLFNAWAWKPADARLLEQLERVEDIDMQDAIDQMHIMRIKENKGENNST